MKSSMAILILSALFVVVSSARLYCGENMENHKSEIIEAERQFAETALQKGVKEAFLHYADDHAVIMRNNRLYKGRDEIGGYFDSLTFRDVVSEWVPDFVEVSSSGDFAYTYGKYTFSATDMTGEKIRSQGIFHTVWKKQPDGKWKFVWD